MQTLHFKSTYSTGNTCPSKCTAKALKIHEHLTSDITGTVISEGRWG
jgi:hypothetical protein